jgi:hypothetical protein
MQTLTFFNNIITTILKFQRSLICELTILLIFFKTKIMKTIKWSFESNPFYLLAGRSLKRFYKFVFSFMSALFAEHATTEIAAIHSALLPHFTAFMDAYLNWKSQQGVRHGDTISKDYLFELLYQEKMNDWHNRIKVVYNAKSAEYGKIFPKGVSPLSNASFDERLVYFNLIIKNAKLYSTLDPITDEMVLFRDEIKTVYNTQQNSVSVVKVTAADLKLIAENMASEMYGGLGALMSFHKQHPKNIRRYFVLSLLHYYKKPNGEPEDLYEVFLAGGETKEAGFVFVLEDRLMLYNSGETKLRFWFVAEINDPMPTTYFDLDADAVKEFVVSTYANANDRFMMIQNLSDAVEGSVEIEKV